MGVELPNGPWEGTQVNQAPSGKPGNLGSLATFVCAWCRASSQLFNFSVLQRLQLESRTYALVLGTCFQLKQGLVMGSWVKHSSLSIFANKFSGVELHFREFDSGCSQVIMAKSRSRSGD